MSREILMQPLVSICIPTYNRAECLKETLSSIVCQEEFKDGYVEVVVSDNASTDNTEQVGSSYEKKYSGIHYYRNKKNILGENLPLVLSRASGKLRKLNNDTAVLLPGSLKYLCEIEKKYENDRPVIFFSNGKNYLKNTQDNEILTFRKFIRKMSFWVTWMPTFSIWDTDCDNIAENTAGCELSLWHVVHLYLLGSRKDKIALCQNPIMRVIVPGEKDISYGLYKVFYENYFKIIDSYVDKGIVTENDRDYLEKDLLINFFPYWIARSELNNSRFKYSKDEDLKKCVYDHYHNKPYWKEFLSVYKKAKVRIFVHDSINRIVGRK